MKRRIAVDLGVLRDSRNLRLLVIGELFSGLGSQAALVAIPFQIYTLTHSAALVGLLGMVELVPIIIGSLFGGAIADRIERRRLMLMAETSILISASALAAITIAGEPPVGLIFLFAALLAGGATVDNVTRSAIVPALAGDRLRAALSINYGLYQVAAVAGPALGGLMIAALGIGSAYAAQAAGFTVMIGVTLALPRLKPAPTETEHLPILQSIREGFTFVRGQGALMGSFAIDLMAMTFGMPRALFAVLALDVFHAGATGTGLLYASVSAGAVVAALTTGWVEHARRLGRIVIGAVLDLGRGDRGRGPDAVAVGRRGPARGRRRRRQHQRGLPLDHQPVGDAGGAARADVVDLHARRDERAAARRPRIGHRGLGDDGERRGRQRRPGLRRGGVPDRRAVPGARGLRRPRDADHCGFGRFPGSLTTVTKNSSIWRTTSMKRLKSTGLVTYALACRS